MTASRTNFRSRNDLTFSLAVPSLSGLFEKSAEKCLADLLDPSDVGETLSEKIIVEAATPSELLKNFLNALLLLLKDQHILFRRIRIEEIQIEPACRLRAEVRGQLFDPHQHALRISLDQFSCQEARLSVQAEGWLAEVSFTR